MGPTSVLLKAGPPPINMIFAQGGRVRILDATAGKTLAAASLDANTIISIDPVGVIVLGRQTPVAGPLSAEHRYEIWWDAGQ